MAERMSWEREQSQTDWRTEECNAMQMDTRKEWRSELLFFDSNLNTNPHTSDIRISEPNQAVITTTTLPIHLPPTRFSLLSFLFCMTCF